MTTIRTDLGNTKESARRDRVESVGGISQKNVQKALEGLDTRVAAAVGASFATVVAESGLSGSRQIAVSSSLTATDGGGGTTLTFDIAAGGVTTAKIAAAAVTYGKIQNVAASRLLGNPTGAPAAPSEIPLGTSGHAVPFLDGANTWSSAQTINAPLTVNTTTQPQVNLANAGDTMGLSLGTIPMLAGTYATLVRNGGVSLVISPTSASGGSIGLDLFGFSNGGGAQSGLNEVLLFSSRGTPGTSSAVLQNDEVGEWGIGGDHGPLAGSRYGAPTATIDAYAEETWSATAEGTNFRFEISKAGTIGRRGVLSIDNSGTLAIGSYNQSGNSLPVGPFLGLQNNPNADPAAPAGTTIFSAKAGVPSATLPGTSTRQPIALQSGSVVGGRAAVWNGNGQLVDNGALQTNAGGTGGLFANPPFGFNAPVNLRIDASVASNILTITLNSDTGSAPDANHPIYIPFRDAAIANGDPVWRTVTGALTISTFAVGATLGSTNGVPFRLWIVAFDNAGTVVLGLINCSTSTQIFPLDETGIQSAVAMSAGATSPGVFYCPNGTTVASRAYRIIGYVEYSAGLATAGTYNIVPTKAQLFGPGVKKPGDHVQTRYGTTTTPTTATNTATPQQTALTVAITPTSTINLIRIDARGVMNDTSAAQQGVAQISRGSGPTLIGSHAMCWSGAGAVTAMGAPFAFDQPQTTSAISYFVYVWCSSAGGGNTVWNYNGALTTTSTMTVDEIMA
jgi:hypothetical protein